jgi:hypothetical protein
MMAKGNLFGRILVVLALTRAVAAPAAAAPPVEVQSTYHVTLGPRTYEPSGTGNIQIVHQANVANATGTFTSTPNGVIFLVRAVVDFNTGQGTFQALATFNGSVGGQSGTALVNFNGSVTNFYSYKGTWSVVSGTGGLATLHGQGDFVQSGGPGTLTGQIQLN